MKNTDLSKSAKWFNMFTSIKNSFVFSWKYCKSFLIFNIAMFAILLLSPYLILSLWRLLIDELLLNKSFSNLVWAYIACYLIIQIICQSVNSFHVAFQQNVKDKTSYIIKENIIDKLPEIDLEMYDDPSFNKTLSVLNSIPNYTDVLNNTLNLMSSVGSLVIATVSVGKIYFIPALAIFLFQIPTVIILCYNSLNSWKLWVEQNDDRRKISYYKDILTNSKYAKEVRLYKLKEYFLGLYENYWTKTFRSSMKLQRKNGERKKKIFQDSILMV